jgi:hypothetical protein
MALFQEAVFGLGGSPGQILLLAAEYQTARFMSTDFGNWAKWAS